MGLLVIRFQSLQLQMRTSHAFKRSLYVLLFYGSPSKTSDGNELTGAQAKSSCTFSGGIGRMRTDNKLTSLVCSKLLHFHLLLKLVSSCRQLQPALRGLFWSTAKASSNKHALSRQESLSRRDVFFIRFYRYRLREIANVRFAKAETDHMLFSKTRTVSTELIPVDLRPACMPAGSGNLQFASRFCWEKFVTQAFCGRRGLTFLAGAAGSRRSGGSRGDLCPPAAHSSGTRFLKDFLLLRSWGLKKAPLRRVVCLPCCRPIVSVCDGCSTLHGERSC